MLHGRGQSAGSQWLMVCGGVDSLSVSEWMRAVPRLRDHW